MVIIGSAIVVLTSFEFIGGLRSLETREMVEEFLAEPPGSNLGLDVPGALTGLRVATMVAAACATAMAIMGWHVLKRNRQARLVVAILAVPLLFAGMITGGLMSTVVAVAAALLWLQPARDWFDGVTREVTREVTHDRPQSPTSPAHRAAGPPSHEGHLPEPSSATPSNEARAWQGFGTAPAEVPAAASPGDPARRPAAVTIACTLAWVFSALLGLLMLVSMVIIALDPTYWLGEVRKQNPELVEQAEVTDQMLSAGIYFVGGVTILWAIAVVVITWFVLRGAPWARVLLIVSAAMTATLALVGSLSNPAMLVLLIAAALTISLLMRPETRAWFRR